MENMDLDRILVITGGGSGLGRAIADRWVDAGGRVAVLDLRFLEAFPSKRYLALECDVTSRDSVLAAVASAEDTFGRIDALVNAAGIMRVEPSSALTEANARAVMDVHWFGAMWAAQAAFTALAAAGGSIVNITSVAGISGMPERTAYNSAKAALDAMTRTLAVEWAPHGIRVNAVAPGYVHTRMTGDLIVQGKLHSEPIVARTPLRRFAEPREIADPVLFLLSAAASFITGHTLYVDGGITIDGNWYEQR